MKENSFEIDLLRAVSCIAVLLYHLGILKGGYLAVCAFFVLSGFFSARTCMRQEKFSILKYWAKRIRRICVPLWITALVTDAVMSLFPESLWLNLRPETASVLFGYNNYWQLQANLDYFTRHVSSPFMHFWYIAILMQFELVFPLLFLFLRFLKRKTGRLVTCLVCADLALVSFAYFFSAAQSGNVMSAYYGTFTRAFSLMTGVCLAFACRPGGKGKYHRAYNAGFQVCLACFAYLLYASDASSPYFAMTMAASSLSAAGMILCAMHMKNRKTVAEPLAAAISSCSYEIYLVQYPVIFLLQMREMPESLRVLSAIALTAAAAWILHAAFDIRKKDRLRILKYAFCAVLACGSLFGTYRFVTAEDHTAEMKQLEEDLSENRKLIEEQQKKYRESMKNEEDAWQAVLENIDQDEEALKDAVTNLRITGIGDSILELAVRDLYKVFPNGYFDGLVNRTEIATVPVINDLKKQGLLADVVVLCVGTNGTTNVRVEDQIMEAIGDRKVFWLNTTHPDYSNFNPSLEAMTERYDNLRIIDWVSVIQEHPKYVISDKVHPTVTGCKVYAQTIYDAVYQEYLKEFREKKEEIIREHEEKEKQKITFIGNDLLTGLYEHLHEAYPEGEYLIDPEYSYETLINTAAENTLSHNVVFLTDGSLNLTEEEWKNLVSACGEREIYICTSGKVPEDSRIHVIPFPAEKEYMMADGIHLNEEGNRILKKRILAETEKNAPVRKN